MSPSNIIGLAYGSHGLNYMDIDRLVIKPITYFKTISATTLRALKGRVQDHNIPSSYTGQIRVQTEVISKIDKAIKARKGCD